MDARGPSLSRCVHRKDSGKPQELRTQTTHSAQGTRGGVDACTARRRDSREHAVPCGANRFSIRACTFIRMMPVPRVVGAHGQRASATQVAHASVDVWPDGAHTAPHAGVGRLRRGRRCHGARQERQRVLCVPRLERPAEGSMPLRDLGADARFSSRLQRSGSVWKSPPE